MTLTIVADIRAKEGREDDLRDALKALVAPTLAEPGCIKYDLHEDNDRPGHFLFYETWESRALWDDGHNVSDHINAFRAKGGDLVESTAIYEMTHIAG